jgi:hypothetical protein
MYPSESQAGTGGNVHIKLSLLFFTPCCGLELGVLAA